MKTSDTAIIGAGPAGISAAMQLARYEIYPFVYESAVPGGLLFNAGTIENYPGFPKGIEGPELAALFAAGLESCKAVVCPEEVLSVDYAAGVFGVQAESEADFSRIVIATGTRPVPLDSVEFDSLDTEDGIDYGIGMIGTIAGKSVAIIGAGDAAFDYALTLSKKNDIVIMQRGEKPRCNAALERRVADSERITVLENAAVEKISREEDRRFALSLCGTGCGSHNRMTADHIIAAIGRVPREIALLSGLSENFDELVASGRLRFAGDVINKMYRQTSIAVGDGVRAAMEIYEGKGLDR
ncbi:MAG: NAD(P)/FAD-dependent oxidoreductase [Candidatus Krumholzibacteria bacterium]|nr:NAD(P)/FAD-dependent oxidoreductase [Candidatus Krumholzibacteria bacterium]